MQIIIPMSGAGDRFVRAGYATPKPLIEVDGLPMVEHVVRMFPGESKFIFICNKLHLQGSPMRETLERIAPGCTIVPIEPHKLGPVHAVLQAEKYIEDDEPCIVNYCDFSAVWDYAHFKKQALSKKWDGCITAYRGFHPHSLGNTYYAYMRADKNNRMQQIREKESFTTDRMAEFASAGTYYFSKGALVKKYFKELVNRKIQKNGEYYASLAYNLMNEDGLHTHIYELDKFLQWGTPEDLQEYQWWSSAFSRLALGQKTLLGSPSSKLQMVLPMAGAGSRFATAGYVQPKPLISVSGRPMFVQAVTDLPKAATYHFIMQKALAKKVRPTAKKNFPGCQFIETNGLTAGQAATVLLSKKSVDLSLPLFIAPCDTGFLWDEKKFAAIAGDPSVDCCVWAFSSYSPSARNPAAYGWLRLGKNGEIASVSCKKPVSEHPIRDYGVTGAFYFREARLFFDAAEEMIRQDRRINGEFYVDESINLLLEAGKKAVPFLVSHYLCWGTPNELKTYEYYQDYFDSNPSHPYKKSKDADFP